QLDFLPGQYARLQVPGSDCRRAYSFANRPNPQNHLQFLIRLLPGGAMSDYLRQGCRVGDEIRFEAPLGTFYLRQVERPLLLVAGGTGLSAFLG
ncbi:anthranilate 1,2-dioxygenase electron transfer component AntC, partial [Pseudomonas aeruginosa]|nr:anthranilate 1,2-dioxygenase electron transfer component AntC [Pseudomonas aeruginosa]